MEGATVFLGIAAVEKCFQNGGVGTWPPNTAFLKFLDETGFGIAARRFGLFCFGCDIGDRERIIRGELGHGHIVLSGEGVELEPAREQKSGTACDEVGNRTIGDIREHFGFEESSARHLRGDGAAENERVEFLLVGRESGFFARRVGGTNRLVRFLGILALCFIDARFGKWFAEFFHDIFRCRVSRVVAHIETVGTHIGDEPRFVEFLGDAHRVCRRESQARACRLLEC